MFQDEFERRTGLIRDTPFDREMKKRKKRQIIIGMVCFIVGVFVAQVILALP